MGQPCSSPVSKRRWPGPERPLRVRLDITQSEHNESGYLPLADIGADIPFRRSGPEGDIQPMRVARQRASGPCDDGGGAVGADLRVGAGAAAGRGGVETLSRISCSVACSLAISSVICCWAAASCSTLCRTAARPSDIALNCCTSGEGVAGAVGATMSGAVWATACGANQRSCGDALAIISLATSP